MEHGYERYLLSIEVTLNRTSVTAFVVTLLALAPLTPAIGSPATMSFVLKDPFVASREAGNLLFGGRNARDYLELMPDGSRRSLPKRVLVEETVRRSDTFTYVMLAGWSLPILYLSFAPDPLREFQPSNRSGTAPLMASVAVAGGLTYLNWLAHSTYVATFFQRTTVELNRSPSSEPTQSPVFR